VTERENVRIGGRAPWMLGDRHPDYDQKDANIKIKLQRTLSKIGLELDLH